MVLHLQKLESPSPKDTLCKVWKNWLSGSGEKNFLISSMYFRYFIIISPWERAGPSFDQIWIPITQGCFVPSLVEIGPVVLKKKIFKVCQCIFAISLLSHLGKGWGPSFEQTWILITQGCFVPSLVEIGPVVLEKKRKMWKVYRQTDNGQQAIRKAHLSFQLRWAKKSNKRK